MRKERQKGREERERWERRERIDLFILFFGIVYIIFWYSLYYFNEFVCKIEIGMVGEL